MSATLADRLDMLRFTHGGISYTELAEATGITRQTLAKYEKGELPQTANLIALADYFDVPIDYLLCRSDCAVPDTRLLDSMHISEMAAQALESYPGYGKLLSLLLEDNEGRELLKIMDQDFQSNEAEGWDLQNMLYREALQQIQRISSANDAAASMKSDPYLEFLKSQIRDYDQEKCRQYAELLVPVLFSLKEFYHTDEKLRLTISSLKNGVHQILTEAADDHLAGKPLQKAEILKKLIYFLKDGHLLGGQEKTYTYVHNALVTMIKDPLLK